jgi:hypothetical protein
MFMCAKIQNKCESNKRKMAKDARFSKIMFIFVQNYKYCYYEEAIINTCRPVPYRDVERPGAGAPAECLRHRIL